MLFKLWKVSFQLFFLGKVLLIVSSMARKTKVALASHDGSHIGCLCETDVYLPLSPLLALQRCRRPPLVVASEAERRPAVHTSSMQRVLDRVH